MKNWWDAESKEDALTHIFKDNIIASELANMLIEDLIGSGVSRYVFNHATNNKRVVKIDMSPWNANAIEYNVWQHVRLVKGVNNWFAQCPIMSRCGRILIMEKVDMNRPIQEYPKEIPHFFADIKKSNFGFIGKQLVCVDYASNLLIEKSLTLKMKRVKWQ